jgi:hypothetical protein
MSERSELHSRREERMENGVKNLKGAKLFLKTFFNHRFGDKLRIDFLSFFYFLSVPLEINIANLQGTV